MFEGAEKRLEVVLAPAPGAAGAPDAPASGGLRALPRARVDALLAEAGCGVVSARACAGLDAYVLSESSLFVHPDRWVLKTCGATRLLRALPPLLEAARALGLAPVACRFSRPAFLRPNVQPWPHCAGAAAEAAALDAALSVSAASASHACAGWHAYSRGDPDALLPCAEICMTGLDPEAARAFVWEADAPGCTDVPRALGLREGFEAVDEHRFRPCGYSMNAVRGDGGWATVHVTPEPGCSYASVELSGAREARRWPEALAAAARLFRPSAVRVALTTGLTGLTGLTHGGLPELPGYSCRPLSSSSPAGAALLEWRSFTTNQVTR